MTGRYNEFDGPGALEAELAELRPAEPSAALFERVGRELDRPHTRPWARAWFIGPFAAAACVVVALLAWRGRGTGHSEPISPTIVSTPAHPATTGSDEADLPALATYRRAWARSPAALDELLDRDARRSLSGGTRTPAAAGFMGPFDVIPH